MHKMWLGLAMSGFVIGVFIAFFTLPDLWGCLKQWRQRRIWQRYRRQRYFDNWRS